MFPLDCSHNLMKHSGNLQRTDEMCSGNVLVTSGKCFFCTLKETLYNQPQNLRVFCVLGTFAGVMNHSELWDTLHWLWESLKGQSVSIPLWLAGNKEVHGRPTQFQSLKCHPSWHGSALVRERLSSFRSSSHCDGEMIPGPSLWSPFEQPNWGSKHSMIPGMGETGLGKSAPIRLTTTLYFWSSNYPLPGSAPLLLRWDPKPNRPSPVAESRVRLMETLFSPFHYNHILSGPSSHTSHHFQNCSFSSPVPTDMVLAGANLSKLSMDRENDSS